MLKRYKMYYNEAVGNIEMYLLCQKYHIWNKVYNFLNELRCENKSESIVVQLENCSKEKDILESQMQVYQDTLQKVPDIERKIIEKYVEQLDAVAFEEQQEAYCQGIVDCIQIMTGMGLIRSEK